MHPTPPSNPDELRRMLNVGMGRAILYLLKQDLSQYRDLILDICLHHVWYDEQCCWSDMLVDYLSPLVEASGDKDFYRDAILGALRRPAPDDNRDQLRRFALTYAREGNSLARELLYQGLQLDDPDDPFGGVDEVLELDGAKGLEYVLRLVALRPGVMEGWSLGHFIFVAEETSGIDDVRIAVKKAASEFPAIAKLLAEMDDYSVDWTAEQVVQFRKDRPKRWRKEDRALSRVTWEELKGRPDMKTRWIGWSRVAPDDEFVAASRDFDLNADPQTLKDWLNCFKMRPFPLDPGPLLQLIDHPDAFVSARAFSALELIHSDKVRHAYLHLIQRPQPPKDVLSLLVSNYQPDDYQAIAGLIGREIDDDRLHGICMDAREVYKNNPVAEALEPLLLCYEKTPCPLCRCSCVRLLQGMGLMPEWMAEEYSYDADHDDSPVEPIALIG